MNAVRMVWAALMTVLVAAGCRSREPADRAPGFGALPELVQLIAYGRGLEQEIAALQAGGQDRDRRWLDSVGAAAAGLSISRYRALVDSMDRFLEERAAARDPDSREPLSLDSLLGVLDSLRVERRVLEVRIGG